MKRLLTIGGVCLILLIAFLYVGPGISPKPNYVIGFPQETSKARTDVLFHYGTFNNIKVTNQTNEVNETSRLLFDESPKLVVYESISDEAIDAHFQPIFGSKDDGKKFSALTSSFIDRLENNEVRATEEGYPEVIIEEDQTITITTVNEERSFNIAELFSDGEKKSSDYFTLDVQRANTDGFLISVYFSDSRVKDLYHLFVSQDFSTIEVVNGEREPFAEHIATGALDVFSEVLFQEEVNERYAVLFDGLGIYDREEQSIVTIKEADKLSSDGKYVYINGDASALKTGKQQIQSIEDYVSGTDKNRTTFKMNFKQIAKEFGLSAVSSTNNAKLVYFTEDYLMYSFSFKAFLFGSAGSVNVIVDLQDNPEDPTFYLFDFRIDS